MLGASVSKKNEEMHLSGLPNAYLYLLPLVLVSRGVCRQCVVAKFWLRVESHNCVSCCSVTGDANEKIEWDVKSACNQGKTMIAVEKKEKR